MTDDPTEAHDFVPLGGEGAGAGGPGPKSRARFDAAGLEEQVPTLRPRRAPEILDMAFDLLRDRFLQAMGLALLLWLPVRIGALLTGVFEIDPYLFDGNSQQIVGFLLFGLILPVVIPQMVTAGVTLLCYGAVCGVDVSVGHAFKIAMKRLPQLCVLSFIIGIGVGIGSMLCLVPGIYLQWKTALSIPSMVLERLSIRESLKRSWSLSEGSVWRYLAVYIVPMILVSSFSGVLAMTDNPGVRTQVFEYSPLPAVFMDWGLVVLSSIMLAVATTITAAVVAAYYIDCIVRRDGHDLVLDLGEMERTHGIEASARSSAGRIGVDLGSTSP